MKSMIVSHSNIYAIVVAATLALRPSILVAQPSAPITAPSDAPTPAGTPTTPISGSAPRSDSETSKPPQLPPPPFTAGWRDGFVVQSDNGEFRLQIGVLAQTDGRFAI